MIDAAHARRLEETIRGEPRSEVRVLLRDRYRCTASVAHWRTQTLGRCPGMGSEMVVVAGRTLCPRCVRRRTRPAEEPRG